MITINLLPYELRPIKRTPLPYIAGGLAFAAVLVIVFITYLAGRSDVNAANRRLAQNQGEYSALLPVITEFNELNAKKQQLDKKAKTIEEIVADRLIWSRELYNFARLLPKNVWYTAIEVKIEPYEELHTEYNAEGVPTTVRIPKTRQIVEIEGYVRPGANGQTNTALLMRMFEEDEEFSRMYTLRSPRFESVILDGLPVKKFTLPMEITPRGPEND